MSREAVKTVLENEKSSLDSEIAALDAAIALMESQLADAKVQRGALAAKIAAFDETITDVAAKDAAETQPEP